jgi:site-specific DNA-cytosine methylase
MNVLSLCDGMSCGQIALKELKIPIDTYYASEIYSKAIETTQLNFPDTIQCGNLVDLYKNEEWLRGLPKIDLILFGFPCKNHSKAVKGRKGYDEGLEGKHSWLFYPCADIVDWLKQNNNPDLLFFCENVDGMKREDREIVSERLGVNYAEVDGNLFSAADRGRLYWSNIKYNINELPKENGLVLKDILDDDVPDIYYYKQAFDFHGLEKKHCATLHINGHDILKRVNSPFFKSATLMACRGGNQQKKVYDVELNKCRKLTEKEYCKLQCVPEWYRFNVAKSHVYNMCGDGWNIEVVKWFFKYITK